MIVYSLIITLKLLLCLFYGGEKYEDKILSNPDFKSIIAQFLNGLSGLGHIILAVGMVWTVVRIFDMERIGLVVEK